jgi:3-phenylpropionate/cinnamic acid dioxygenase small subunit
MSIETSLRGSDLTDACTRFLCEEAHLLDQRQFTAWLRVLSPDIVYEVPVRTARIRGIDEYSDQAFYFKENYSSLEARVARYGTDYGWAEDPPSKTRRFIAGTHVVEADADDVLVRSNLMLLRYRMDQSVPDILSGERLDRLQFADGRWLLRRRSVYLDASVLGTHNLSVFL